MEKIKPSQVGTMVLKRLARLESDYKARIEVLETDNRIMKKVIVGMIDELSEMNQEIKRLNTAGGNP